MQWGFYEKVTDFEGLLAPPQASAQRAELHALTIPAGGDQPLVQTRGSGEPVVGIISKPRRPAKCPAALS